MPKRSKVHTLPAAVKEWLDQSLVENNFAGYEALEAELASRGCKISKSALHRYGQAFESKLEALKVSTDMAKAVVAASPDDENAQSDALMRLWQSKAFDVLLKMEADPDISFSQVGLAIAKLTSAGTSLKKYQTDVRQKAKAAVGEIKKTAKKGGLSAEAIREIEEQVLGIVR